eukprot:TRINITY_DN13797_c0_g1_i1.p2 TRINITY_DN13797_c0_g1~~TRINITY_DN13797_c0_g1_i1.p2  ORF type:complete len:97 (+),score=3.08 TRINITY_DN13797_c0_g1_i1:262-552(+)
MCDISFSEQGKEKKNMNLYEYFCGIAMPRLNWLLVEYRAYHSKVSPIFPFTLHFHCTVPPWFGGQKSDSEWGYFAIIYSVPHILSYLRMKITQIMS